MALRLAVLVAAVVPSVAVAQAWFVRGGVTARGEFNDNYFLTSTGKQSAFTASVTPFVTAAQQTQTTDVTAVLAVGLNRVWGPSPTTDYVSGLLGLRGAISDERSTWTGAVSFSRAPSLQNAQTPAGVVLVRAYTNAASVNGTYSYALTERWSVGATAGWYGNSYSAVESGSASSLSDNSGYNVGAVLSYRATERTDVVASAVFWRYSSDITRADAVVPTLGVVHEFSPQLTVSGAVAGYWSDIETKQTAFVCPTSPILCSTGIVQPMLVFSGDQRHDSGPLFGGSVNYAFSQRTQLYASLSQTLAPGSTGGITRTGFVGASLLHRFSDRLTGRLGASYGSTRFPAGLSNWYTDKFYQGEIGASFQLAEYWALDVGYRYMRAAYADNPSEPSSNIVFISVAYNWPGASPTDWLGARGGREIRPGAGPILLPARREPPTSPESPPERSRFDAFPLQ